MNRKIQIKRRLFSEETEDLDKKKMNSGLVYESSSMAGDCSSKDYLDE